MSTAVWGARILLQSFSFVWRELFLETVIYPVKIDSIERICSEEAKQIGDEFRSITGGANDIAEHRLSSRTVVGKGPSAKGDDSLQVAVLLF